MGIVRVGVPKELTLHLKNSYLINTFIETGTYLGYTAQWAARHFETHSIEMSEKYYKNAKKLLHGTYINLYHGNSKYILEELLANVKGGVIFWLDAHWSGGDTYGEDDECPLIEEIDIIKKHLQGDAFIMIDDARLFLAPPPRPHQAEKWPAIQEIVERFDLACYYMAIYEDVIIIVPNKAKASLVTFLQNQTTNDWEKWLHTQQNNRGQRFLSNCRTILRRIIR